MFVSNNSDYDESWSLCQVQPYSLLFNVQAQNKIPGFIKNNNLTFAQKNIRFMNHFG